MKLLTTIILTSMAVGFIALAAPIDWSKLPPTAMTENVTFAKDIAPLFKESCVRCHGAEKPKAQLRLDTLEGTVKGTKLGPILKAGDSANSLLVKSVSQLDPEIAMPPKPHARRSPGGLQGTNASALKEHGAGLAGGEAGTPRREHREDNEDRGPRGPQGTNAPGQRPRNFGPPAKPLTAEQVGLVRAWIDQGAK